MGPIAPQTGPWTAEQAGSLRWYADRLSAMDTAYTTMLKENANQQALFQQQQADLQRAVNEQKAELEALQVAAAEKQPRRKGSTAQIPSVIVVSRGLIGKGQN